MSWPCTLELLMTDRQWMCRRCREADNQVRVLFEQITDIHRDHHIGRWNSCRI